LHTNNGKEYVILELQFFLKKQEIIYETSIPYAHQQNSYTKQLNYILLEKEQLIQLEVYLLDS